MTSGRVAPAIRDALAKSRPVVALESALITHGYSHPANLTIARRLEAVVGAEGAVPATIALLDGKVQTGLSDDELARLAFLTAPEHPPSENPRKISLRDLPVASAGGESGGTTVAATMHVAHQAGIKVLATGGIGGVHRGHPEDVSADLTTLGSIPLTVVCSGAKAILDLPRTMEVLETQGVPVVGYQTEHFPAFYSRRSGLRTDVAVNTPEEVADLVQARDALSLPTAILVCVPPPEDEALSTEEAEAAIRQATEEADAAGVTGEAVTPFLLARIVDLTEGRARKANDALLAQNARVAARIAGALADVDNYA